MLAYRSTAPLRGVHPNLPTTNTAHLAFAVGISCGLLPLAGFTHAPHRFIAGWHFTGPLTPAPDAVHTRHPACLPALLMHYCLYCLITYSITVSHTRCVPSPTTAPFRYTDILQDYCGFFYWTPHAGAAPKPHLLRAGRGTALPPPLPRFHYAFPRPYHPGMHGGGRHLTNGYLTLFGCGVFTHAFNIPTPPYSLTHVYYPPWTFNCAGDTTQTHLPPHAVRLRATLHYNALPAHSRQHRGTNT